MLNGGLVAEGILRVRVSSGEGVEEEHIDLGQVRNLEVAGDITEHKDNKVLRLTLAQGG